MYYVESEALEYKHQEFVRSWICRQDCDGRAPYVFTMEGGAEVSVDRSVQNKEGLGHEGTTHTPSWIVNSEHGTMHSNSLPLGVGL